MNYSKICGSVFSACRLARLYSESAKRPEVSELLHNASNFDLNSAEDPWINDAYPINKSIKISLQKETRLRNMRDPRTTTIILFPGQGAQYTGMANNLLDVPGVKDMFKFASSVMKIDLLKLCLEGPTELLNMTINCQAAMLLTSLAALEKLKCSNPELIERCVCTAGFSVGEYAALVFGGTISFEDAVQLVKVRGEAMQLCSERRPSGLMTTYLRPDAKLELGMKLARDWCQEKEGVKDPVCEIANFLYPHCKVIGGDLKTLDFIQRNAKEIGVKKYKRLTVSGAFHTALMKPAAPVLKKALAQVDIQSPGIQVISNMTAVAHTTPEAIRKQLIDQVYKPIKWEQVMQRMFKRDANLPFPDTYEVGPGNTLRPILRMINAKAYEQSYKADM